MSETFYIVNLIAKLSPILLLYLWRVSPSVNKRNKQVKHGSEFTWLCALCEAGVNQFNDIFTSFYARQWYDVTNGVTRASLTVEDPSLIKALRIEKGLRCGWNDCGISCQTVETTNVSK